MGGHPSASPLERVDEIISLRINVFDQKCLGSDFPGTGVSFPTLDWHFGLVRLACCRVFGAGAPYPEASEDSEGSPLTSYVR